MLKNILLSSRDISPRDNDYRKLIAANLVFYCTILGLSAFTIINILSNAFFIAFIDFLFVLPSLLGIYLLRKNYDINKLANFASVLLFVLFVSVVYNYGYSRIFL